jgi:hypothetical protein
MKERYKMIVFIKHIDAYLLLFHIGSAPNIKFLDFNIKFQSSRDSIDRFLIMGCKGIFGGFYNSACKLLANKKAATNFTS